MSTERLTRLIGLQEEARKERAELVEKRGAIVARSPKTRVVTVT
jgi:hypothetical protein